MDTFFMTGNLLAICMALGMLLGYNMRRKEIAILKKQLVMLKSRYRQVYGFHEWFGVYDLESFDCGQMWYAMSSTSDGRRLIRGEAKDVYPGLLSELDIFECHDMVSPEQPCTPPLQAKKTAPPRNVDIVPKKRPQKVANRIQTVLKERVRNQSHCRSLPILRPDSKLAAELDELP